jgi:hypothetical protein
LTFGGSSLQSARLDPKGIKKNPDTGSLVTWSLDVVIDVPRISTIFQGRMMSVIRYREKVFKERMIECPFSDPRRE